MPGEAYPLFSPGEGTGAMSNIPSREYRIMQRHLSSSCVRQCCICLVRAYKGSNFPQNLVGLIQWFSGAGCEISLTQWFSISHCVSYCSTQINPFLLFLTHHHFHDPFFFTSQRSAMCEGREESSGVNDLFTPRGTLRAFKS